MVTYRSVTRPRSDRMDRGRAGEARPFLEAYLRAAPPALEASDMARVRGWLGGPAGR